MIANDPIGIVQRMFSAFTSRDMQGLLETVHPDSRWIYIGANPQLSHAEYVGSAAVRRFIERILERVDMTSFAPAEFIAQGDTVIVFGSEGGRVKATGRPFRNEWVQRYVVRAGLIVEMTEYNVQVEPR